MHGRAAKMDGGGGDDNVAPQDNLPSRHPERAWFRQKNPSKREGDRESARVERQTNGTGGGRPVGKGRKSLDL
jgi:hypothetical protein